MEARFARFKRTDRSLYFSSGYLANLAVMTTFAEAGDVMISDERNHASLIDGIRLSDGAPRNFRAQRRRRDAPRHRKRGSRVGSFFRPLRAESRGECFVVVESLFSMDGDEAPLADYAGDMRGDRRPPDRRRGARGRCAGERGSGLIEEQGVGDRVFLSVNTAGKALASAAPSSPGRPGRLITSIQRARTSSSRRAPPPALASALDGSLDLVEGAAAACGLAQARRDPARAAAGGRYPRRAGHIAHRGRLIGGNEAAVAVADAMQADGFDVRAIRPPSVPPGTARLRISVNVNLTDDVIERCVASLASACQKVSCSAGSS